MPVQQIPNLIQGVSQQAVQQRRDTQCEEQFDCINSIVDGCAARPHFEVVKVWAGRTLTGAFMEAFERSDEYYLVGIYDEAAFAINLDTGVDCTIGGADYPNDTGYLDAVVGVDPRDQFRMQAVEDAIFIANRQTQPAMDPSIVSPALVNEALVWVRGAVTGASTLDIDGPGGSDITHANTQNTSTGIATAFEAAVDGVSGFSAERVTSTVRIWRSDNADFSVVTGDGTGDEIVKAYKGFIDGTSKLPAKAFDGMRMEVRGESRTTADNYWLEWVGSTSTGAWRETVAPDTETTIDRETMPHTLRLTAGNTFEWQAESWSTRVAGDDETARDPGFIGSRIRDMFYYKNRLGIVHEGGAVWSKARYPFTFFPDTLQTVLATAPVDVVFGAAQAGKGAVTVDFPVQIDKTLSFWAQGSQFEVTHGQDNFKQESVGADPSTAYEYAPGAKPLALGKFLYFATEAGPWASLFAVPYQNSQAGMERDVTQHVNSYITSGIRKLTGSTVFGQIFIASDGAPSSLYLWSQLFGDGQFLQSAWNTWRIPGGTILWVGLKGNYLRVLQQRAEGVALLRADLTPRVKDDITGATYLTRLDLRVTQAQVTSLSYDSGTGRTTFTLPYTPTVTGDMKVVLMETVGSEYRGQVFPVVSITGAVVVVTGDLSGGKKFVVGQKISAERTESRFMVRNPDKGALPLDRLTVERFGLEVSSSSYTRIEVTRPNGDTKSYEWEGRTAGLPTSVIGTPILANDMIDVPVDGLATERTIRLVNDSFLPSYWQSASYTYTGIGKAGQK